ncbi:MAG: formylglycine-generating enzyme family protein [Planctomycetota bacterium]|nr:formylglycine-generating enzyme family protein [Planctomycetota bacterium]
MFKSLLWSFVFGFVCVVAAWADEPAASSAKQKHKVIENSLGMKLVLIPDGEFVMGNSDSPDDLALAYPEYARERLTEIKDEYPAHRVHITKPFYFGQHEVTVGQFRKYLESSGAVPESISDQTGGYGYNPAYDPKKTKRGDAFEGRDPKYSWQNNGFPQGDDHPVLNVTWNDANQMCKWLSQREDKTYRLPTEAEWEYVCRAGTQTRYHNGPDPESLTQVANVFDVDSKANWPQWKQYALAKKDGFAFTAPVGSFASNAFGVYDMHGNAWEWCSDWHGDTYYAESPINDPTGPKEGSVRVRRGGSWHTWSFYARSSYRNWNDESTRYTLVGMRIVCEATP